MADTLNSFPLVLSIKEDGSLKATVGGIEQYITASAGRATQAFAGLARQVTELTSRRVSAGADPFGWKAMVAGLSSAPLQKVINEQSAAENSLAQQRARARAENIAGIQREFDSAMSAIRARQTAQTAAFKQAEAEGNALIALDQQRAAALAALVAAPSQKDAGIYFDPRGAQAAAVAARTQAAALNQVAEAARTVATAASGATAADRAFAVSAREAATAAGIEADRLEQLAATHGRVAAAAVAAGGKIDAAGTLVQNSVRGQRFATIQASQQFQDLFIQVQGGQNVLIAFSQQASQLAFVMAGAGGTAGKFASFIAGPYGTLILGGIAVLSLLTGGLFDNKKAHEAAEKAAKAFGDRQADIKNFIAETTGALIEQNKTLVLNALLTRQAQIAKNEAAISEGRKNALRIAGNQQARNPTFAGVSSAGSPILARQTDPDVQAAIRAARGDIDKLATSIANLASTKRPDLKGLALDLSTQAGEAILATRENKKLNEQISALGGNTSGAFRNLGAVEPLIAATAATDKYAKKIAELRVERAKLAEAVERGDYTSKGGREKAIAEAAAIDRQIEAQQKASAAAKKAASAGSADAKRIAGERRQELFAEAAAIGDGTEAIKAANSTYAAEILRLKNQLREGLISPDVAKQAAITARQVRNAAVDIAQGAKALDDELQRAAQQFDGEASFVDRIQKASAAVAKARAELGALGTAKIGENIYDAAGLDKLQAGIDRAYVKPITDATRALDEQRQIDEAMLANRPVEAEYLRRKFSILQSYGDLTAEEKANLEGQIAPLRRALELEQQRGLALDAMNAKRRVELDYLNNTASALRDATQAIARGDVKGLIQTPGKLLDAFEKMQGDKLFEDLFGQTFRNLEAEINGTSGLKGAADRFAGEVDNVSTASKDVVAAFKELATSAAAAATASAGGSGSLVGDMPIPPEMRQWLDLIGTPYDAANPQDIVVTGQREQTVQLGSKTLTRLSEDGKSSTKNLLEKLTPVLQAASIGRQIGTLLGGKAGGSIGAGIGGLARLVAGDNPQLDGILDGVGKGIQGYTIGAAIGTPIGELIAGKGKRKSDVKVGGMVGAGLGFAIAGPIGAAVGAILGSITGGIFAKTNRGGALVTSTSGSPYSFGNDAATQANANSLGGAVQQGLAQIVNQLGATLGSFAVSIGYFGDKIRVDTSGYTGSLDSKHAPALHGFATEEEAVRFAILDAIRDGAVKGLREGSIRLLEAGTDLDAAVQKALSFEQVFKDLKARTDPMGYALDQVNAKFDTLRKTFAEAGATTQELADLEKLYGLERADAVKQAQAQISGALQDLLDGLRYKSDTGLSLRTRNAAAEAAFNPLAATVRAGGVVDQDAFVNAAQAYLDIQRQLYGSSQTYFDKLAEITALTEKAIVNAGGTVTATAQQVAFAAQNGAPVATTGTYSALAGTSAGAALGIAANDNGGLGAALAQAIYAQTEALRIPVDRVAQMTPAQMTEAFRAALTAPAGATDNVLPLRTDPALVAAMERQIATLEQQTATLTAQLSATNQNLGKLIDIGGREGGPLILPLRGNF